jgi:hypothetical protein
MMKRIKHMVVALAMVFGVGLLATPALAAADAKSDACQAIGSDAGCTTNTDGGIDVNDVIITVISILSFIVGLVAVIMIIVGGFKFVTSGGDATAVTNAKKTIVYALVGLVVAGFAQVLVQFVLSKLTKTPERADGVVTMLLESKDLVATWRQR